MHIELTKIWFDRVVDLDLPAAGAGAGAGPLPFCHDNQYPVIVLYTGKSHRRPLILQSVRCPGIPSEPLHVKWENEVNFGRKLVSHHHTPISHQSVGGTLGKIQFLVEIEQGGDFRVRPVFLDRLVFVTHTQVNGVAASLRRPRTV